MYLENINSPSDIQKLNLDELRILADETRDALILKISLAGGHNGPNLGMVEVTTPLHYTMFFIRQLINSSLTFLISLIHIKS